MRKGPRLPHKCTVANRLKGGKVLSGAVSPHKSGPSPKESEVSPDKSGISPCKCEICAGKCEISPGKSGVSPNECEVSPNKSDVSASNCGVSAEKIRTADVRVGCTSGCRYGCPSGYEKQVSDRGNPRSCVVSDHIRYIHHSNEDVELSTNK